MPSYPLHFANGDDVNFLGNEKSVRDITAWLQRRKQPAVVSVYCNTCKRPSVARTNPGEEFATCIHCNERIDYPMEDFAIICGNSGNGKTYLCKQLASAFDYQLREITADDINSKEDLNIILKTTNNKEITGKKKIIVIDDVPAIRRKLGRMQASRYIKKIFDVAQISHYPVIFTTDTYKKSHRGKLFPDYITKNAKKIWINKPPNRLMIKFLKKIKDDVDEDKLKEIAQKSPSVRSAIKSVQTNSINDVAEEKLSNRQLLKMMSARMMTASVTMDNIHMIGNSITLGRKTNIDDLVDVMERFADFDYRVKGKYQGIDPWIINHVPEKIENVWFANNYRNTSFKRSHLNFDEVIKSTKKSKKSKKKTKSSTATLDGFI